MPLVPRDTALSVVIRGLAPYLGENVARAAVRGHAEKVSPMGGPLDEAALERLLTALRPGLAVFVGRDKTDHVLLGIRRGLDQARRPV